MPPKRKAPPAKGAAAAKKAKTTKAAATKPAAKPRGRPPGKKTAIKPKPKASQKKAATKSPSKKAASPAKKAAAKVTANISPLKRTTPRIALKKPSPRGRSASPVKKAAQNASGGRSKSVPAKKIVTKARGTMRSPPPVKRIAAASQKKTTAAAKDAAASPAAKKSSFPKLKPLKPRENAPPRSTGRASKQSTPQKTPEKKDKSPRGTPTGSPARSPGRPAKSPTTTPIKPVPVTPGKKIFVCSICEEVFYTSFDLWAHKKDIHENPPLMSPEKALEILAAAEKREKEKKLAAAQGSKAPKRKLDMAAKQPVATKKTKAVEKKDKTMAKQIDNLDTDTSGLLKREKIEQLKGKVMQLRKEAGKPAPGAAGKKRGSAEAEKNAHKLMTEVEKVLSAPPKRSRSAAEMTVKEQLDLMETELDLELRRIKQESAAASKDTGRKLGTSLGPKTAAIKIATTPKPVKPQPITPVPVTKTTRKEPGEISFKEEGEISYMSEGPPSLEPGEIYLGPSETSDGKGGAAKVKKVVAKPINTDSPRPAAKAAATNVVVKTTTKPGGTVVVTTQKAPVKAGVKVIGSVKVSPPAKVQPAAKTPVAKVATEARHMSDAVPELSLESPSTSTVTVKTLVRYKCANTICDQYFTDFEKLRKHEEACAQVDNHSTGTFTCAECGLCFNSQLMLTRHKNQKFGCAAASKRLVPVASKTGQSGAPAMVSCNTCDRFFANAANMHQHARHCTGPGKQRKDAKCPICNKAFPSVQSLQAHCAKDHNFTGAQVLATGRNKYVPAKGVTCLDCGEWFQARLELIQHKRKCGKEGFAKESFACMICSAKCYTRVSLYDHMKSAHGDDEATYKWLTFSCTSCKMIFESQEELEKHKYKKHNMTGPSSPAPVQTQTKPAVAASAQKPSGLGNKVMLPVEVVKKAAQAAKEGKPAVLDLSQAVTIDAAMLNNPAISSQISGGKKEIMIPTSGGSKPAPMMILDMAKLQQMVSTGKGQVFVAPTVAKQISAKKAAAEWNKERAGAPEENAATAETTAAKPAAATKPIVIQPVSPQPSTSGTGTPKHKPAILRTSPAAKTTITVQASGPQDPPSVRMLKPIDKNRMMCMSCKRVLNSMDEIATHSCIQKARKEAGEVQWK